MALRLRLRQAREDSGFSQRELARRADVSQQLISKLESGAVESTTEIFKISEALQVDARWLSTGQGRKSGNEVALAPQSATAEVPLVSWVAAGPWRELPDSQENDKTMIPVTCRVSQSAYALKVRGDSMEPGFPNGCIIVVDPSGDARHGSYIVVRLDDAKEATFKQLIIDGGVRLLKPMNPRYPIMEIKEDATFCGVVKQMVMDFE